MLVLSSHKQLKEYSVTLEPVILSSIKYTQFEAFSHLHRKWLNQHTVKDDLILKDKLLKVMKYTHSLMLEKENRCDYLDVTLVPYNLPK